MPRNVVTNPYFDWADDRPPRTPYHEAVIYEVHVRGLTMRHPEVPPGQRGTYAGLACPAVIDHLTRLGVTAVELMPVHQFVSERRLPDGGWSNYWGYNTIGFLAPHNGYSSAAEPHGQVTEFKSMVKALHAAGIEVILDVVYNHTAEAGASVRRCRSAASTTPRTTGSTIATHPSTWTTAAAVIASMPAARKRCS